MPNCLLRRRGLNARSPVFDRGVEAWHPPRGYKDGLGNFCRVVDLLSTIPGQVAKVFENRSISVGYLSAMRVYGPNGTALAATPAPARRTAGGSFNVSEQDVPRNSTAAASLRAISTVDALIALQGVENPTSEEARGRQGMQRAQRSRHPQARFARRWRRPTTLARLRVASEGLTGRRATPA